MTSFRDAILKYQDSNRNKIWSEPSLESENKFCNAKYAALFSNDLNQGCKMLLRWHHSKSEFKVFSYNHIMTNLSNPTA